MYFLTQNDIINITNFATLETSTIDFGRAKQVLLSQLNEPNLKHLFFERSEIND